MDGHVHHWRHGWIPLSHFAALQKAHGSHKGAAKYLNESNGHHGTESHKLGGGNPHHVGQKVEARQPGIHDVTKGEVVGHTSNGMVQVKYSDRHGRDVVGTFNPSHVNGTATSPSAGAATGLHSVGQTSKMMASGVQEGDIVHVPSISGGGVKRYKIDKAYAPKSNGDRNVDVTNLATGMSTEMTLQGDGKPHVVERKKH